MREVVAEFERPVMLYSIGKDSSVLLHLALKAFYPGKPPFPLLHVDTTWKFRDMIAFRDKTARELGLDLIVHTNHDGLARNINPFDHPPSVYTDVMKTVALRQALARLAQRHEGLRTSFRAVDGVPVSILAKTSEASLTVQREDSLRRSRPDRTARSAA